MLTGYQWIGYNQKYHKANTPHAFGRVAIFIKNEVAKDFSLSIVDKQFDWILILELKPNISRAKIILVSCYPPPENSKYGKNAQGFFLAILFVKYVNMKMLILYRLLVASTVG